MIEGGGGGVVPRKFCFRYVNLLDTLLYLFVTAVLRVAERVCYGVCFHKNLKKGPMANFVCYTFSVYFDQIKKNYILNDHHFLH